jgi:hypothetical protein
MMNGAIYQGCFGHSSNNFGRGHQAKAKHIILYYNAYSSPQAFVLGTLRHVKLAQKQATGLTHERLHSIAYLLHSIISGFLVYWDNESILVNKS